MQSAMNFARSNGPPNIPILLKYSPCDGVHEMLNTTADDELRCDTLATVAKIVNDRGLDDEYRRIRCPLSSHHR